MQKTSVEEGIFGAFEYKKKKNSYKKKRGKEKL